MLSFFFNDTATTEIYTLSLHDALPIFCRLRCRARRTLQCPQSGAAPAQPGHRPKPAQARIGGQERPGLPARAGRVREFRSLPMAFRRWAAATESPRALEDIPAKTDESDALSKDL